MGTAPCQPCPSLPAGRGHPGSCSSSSHSGLCSQGTQEPFVFPLRDIFSECYQQEAAVELGLSAMALHQGPGALQSPFLESWLCHLPQQSHLALPALPQEAARAHSLHPELFQTSQPRDLGLCLPRDLPRGQIQVVLWAQQCQGVPAPAWAQPAVGSLSTGRNSRKTPGILSLDQLQAIPGVAVPFGHHSQWHQRGRGAGATSGPPSAGWVQPGQGFLV